MRNIIVFTLSVLTLIASIVWFYRAPGFEPLLGFLPGLITTIASWPFPLAKRLTAAQKVKAREHWRPIFEKFFQDRRLLQHGVDVIIHDVGRVDTYPELPEEKRISSWFRAGLIGTYHRGVLLGLRWAQIAQGPDGKWKEVSNPDEGKFVALLGQVPFDCIESVNWDGDDFYNKPHLYLHFDFKGEPYERIVYAEETPTGHYSDVVDYADTIPPAFSWRRPVRSLWRLIF